MPLAGLTGPVLNFCQADVLRFGGLKAQTPGDSGAYHSCCIAARVLGMRQFGPLSSSFAWKPLDSIPITSENVLSMCHAHWTCFAAGEGRVKLTAVLLEAHRYLIADVSPVSHEPTTSASYRWFGKGLRSDVLQEASEYAVGHPQEIVAMVSGDFPESLAPALQSDQLVLPGQSCGKLISYMIANRDERGFKIMQGDQDDASGTFCTVKVLATNKATHRIAVGKGTPSCMSSVDLLSAKGRTWGQWGPSVGEVQPQSSCKDGQDLSNAAQCVVKQSLMIASATSIAFMVDHLCFAEEASSAKHAFEAAECWHAIRRHRGHARWTRQGAQQRS